LEITQLNVSDIRIERPFSIFFPINDDTLNAIRIDMKTNGFDLGFPLIVWKERQILVDGHTRFIAAKEMGVTELPVLFKEFESEDDAVLYAFHIQRNRRNLTDDHIIRCLEVLDKIGSKKTADPSKPKAEKKETVETIAKELGTSKSKIEKARKIMEIGSEEIKESVQSGKTSINKAYNDIQTQRRESGELKGAKTNGLASDARYFKSLQALKNEIRFLKDDDWKQLPMERVLADLENLIAQIHEGSLS
jgi:ParB family chromosome partitioning protein